jgi:hypothetical protein
VAVGAPGQILAGSAEPRSVALASLGAAPEERAAALAAYEIYRPADDVPAIRTACAKKVPGCALERMPVHGHVLRRIE